MRIERSSPGARGREESEDSGNWTRGVRLYRVTVGEQLHAKTTSGCLMLTTTGLWGLTAAVDLGLKLHPALRFPRKISARARRIQTILHRCSHDIIAPDVGPTFRTFRLKSNPSIIGYLHALSKWQVLPRAAVKLTSWLSPLAACGDTANFHWFLSNIRAFPSGRGQMALALCAMFPSSSTPYLHSTPDA